ncbi:serpin family protein [Leucobacter soli]|uniref:serpin family protein n=1 Tax=Leucobacter soli TaxID=2812850 RepID=UPI00360CDE79
MKRTAGLIAALAVPLLALSACATPDTEPPATPDASGELRAQNVSMRTVALSEAEALDAAVAATGALGLLALEAAPHEGNVVVSPAGLATALAMLTEGAKGRSLEDLEAALGATGRIGATPSPRCSARCASSRATRRRPSATNCPSGPSCTLRTISW